MKRLILIILAFSLLLPLLGCTKEEGFTCTFYYLRSEDTIDYGSQDALIAPVKREISGQVKDLNYLLRLYLSTTLQDNYRSPFPAGTYLLNAFAEEDTLVIVLSAEFSTLEQIQLSLACACLCTTCFELTDAENIRIHSAEETYAFHRSSFRLLDETAPSE